MVMDPSVKRLEDIRKVVDVAKNVFSEDGNEVRRACAAENLLAQRAAQDIPFILRLLDEARADRQALIDGIMHFKAEDVGMQALDVLLDSVGSNPGKCADHNPKQHRDARPPWCRKCGLTKDFKNPESKFDKR